METDRTGEHHRARTTLDLGAASALPCGRQSGSFNKDGEPIYIDPFVPLLKALYGHPESGLVGKAPVLHPHDSRMEEEVRLAPGHLDSHIRCSAGRVNR